MSGTVDETLARHVGTTLKQITAQVSAALEMLNAGQIVHLEGLEGAVEALCADLARLPAAMQQDSKIPLAGMIDEFNRLTTALESQRDKFGGELKGLTDGQRAATAYIKPSTR